MQQGDFCILGIPVQSIESLWRQCHCLTPKNAGLHFKRPLKCRLRGAIVYGDRKVMETRCRIQRDARERHMIALAFVSCEM